MGFKIKRDFVIGALGILIVFFASQVVFHEFVHVALNDFRFDSFCFLDCPSEIRIVSTQFGPALVGFAGVFLSEPVNPVALDENVVMLISLVLSVITVGILFFGWLA